jgi:hypothetical protein
VGNELEVALKEFDFPMESIRLFAPELNITMKFFVPPNDYCLR